MNNTQLLWVGPQTSTSDFSTVPIAYGEQSNIALSPKQRQQIINAFNAQAYDMASEYAWKKTMVRLKETIASFGFEFIREMLQRQDIDEYTPLVNVLSDYDAIVLSEKVGIINTEGAMQLRHAREELSYYFSSQAEDENLELSALNAAKIICDCAKHVLSIKNVAVETSFSTFKGKLIDNIIKKNDETYNQIVNSTLFYLRTVFNILLSTIKSGKNAQMECAVDNLNLLIEPIWEKITEEDKYNVGKAYRDVVADGKEQATKGLRKALMKVKGFNYVPESLRSDTFIDAANHLIEVHFDFNNFYNEVPAIKSLANLGTSIPDPAFVCCLRAYILVLTGNYYGISNEAHPIAEEELSKISKDKWHTYFKEHIHVDEAVLNNINASKPIERFRSFLISNGFTDFDDLPKDNAQLYKSILTGDLQRVQTIIRKMRTFMGYQ